MHKVLLFQLQHQSFQWIFRVDFFRIDWFDLLAVQGLSRVFSMTTLWKHQFFGTQPSLWSNSHIHIWLLEKTIALTIWIFVGKVMFLFFNILSWFVIAFLPYSILLLIYSWTHPSISPFIHSSYTKVYLVLPDKKKKYIFYSYRTHILVWQYKIRADTYTIRA